MSKSEKKQNEINQWLMHKSNASERALYSIKRLDILTISISGACIYLVFELLKFFNSKEGDSIEYCPILLKVSAVLAVIAIILNFISQIFGHISNDTEIKYASHELAILNGIKTIKNKELKKIAMTADSYSKTTNRLNYWSYSFMTLSIIGLIIFNLITF